MVQENRDTNNSITVNVMETDHSVQWAQAAVIKTEEFTTKRKIQEALTVRATNNNMNLDPGLIFGPDCSLSFFMSSPFPHVPFCRFTLN